MPNLLSAGFAKGGTLLKRCNARGDLLLLAFAALFAPLLFSNMYGLAPKIFFLVFLPAAFVMWFSLDWRFEWPRIRLALAFNTDSAFSIIIIAVFVYLLSMNLSSWSQPDFNHRLVDQQWALAGEILLFMVITAQAVAFIPRFLTRLIYILVPLVAISALISICPFLASTGWKIFDDRLTIWLGMPGYTNSTNISLTYAVFFVAALAAALNKRSSLFLKIWLVPFSLILLGAILLTQARSAYVGTAVGAIAALLITNGSTAWRKSFLKYAAVILTVGAVFVAVPRARNMIGHRGESYRAEIWKTYAENAIAKPLLGYGGLSNIDIVVTDGNVFDQPHNLIMSAQIRGGIFCMLAMFTILSASVWWGLRFFASRQCAIPLAMAATIATTGMFDYNLLITGTTWPWITFWFPWAICAGAEIATRVASLSPREAPGIGDR